MPSLRQIRRHIRSVQNISKVTRAMEMVAATKMRRAQQATLSARPYAQKMGELLSHLAAMPPGEVPHPFLQERPLRRAMVVHITPDRGLCGGLPSNLNRSIAGLLLKGETPLSVVAVGRKGRDFLARARVEMRAVFTGLGDRPTLADVLPIARLAIQDYLSGEVDRVYLHYARFINTMVQRPVLEQLLPVQPAPLPPAQAVGYIYEPASPRVLEALLPRYVEMLVYHAVLESVASEQSARMVAMRNATENAKEVIRELTLLANKVRQESITKELLDIIGGTWAFQRA